MNFPITYACNLHPLDIAHRAANSLCHPIMATYAPRKDADINENVLQEVRKNAVAEARNCDTLYMIGVNPITDPKDDPFCAELLRLHFKRVVYVGKGAAPTQAIAKIFPETEIHQEGLSAFIDKQRKETG